MTPPQLTKEQKQFIADMMAEMLAENAKSAKPKRIMLDSPHDTTEVYNHRLPLDMGAALIEMGKELNASRSYIVYHLLRFAITTSLTDQMQGIASLSAFQKYRKDFR